MLLFFATKTQRLKVAQRLKEEKEKERKEIKEVDL